MAEHDEKTNHGSEDDPEPQRLSVLLLSEMYGAGIRPANPPGQGMASKLVRKVSGDKRRNYNMQPPRPTDLPVLGTAYTNQDFKVPPVYDVACMDSPTAEAGRTSAETDESDISKGYLQPMAINPKVNVKPPKASPSSNSKPYLSLYNDQRAAGKAGALTALPSPIYDMTGNQGYTTDEGLYDPVHTQQCPTQDAVSKKKTRGFPKWKRNKGAIKNKNKATRGDGSGGKSGGFFTLKNLLKFKNRKEERHSSHVYAEPEPVGALSPEAMPRTPPTTDVTPDKYSQFVRGSGAIYANDKAKRDKAISFEQPDYQANSASSQPSRFRRFFGERRKLPSCLAGISRRRVMCVIVTIVILVLLLTIGLMVYYFGVLPMQLRSGCPSDQYVMASVGVNDIPVSWNDAALKGVASSHRSGDTFPAGKTTVVTYGKVCSFNVTVEAEGRPSYQITVDSVTTTTMSISWAVPVFNASNTIPLTYSVHIVNPYGREVTLSSSVTRAADSGIRALSYQLTDLIPGYGYVIRVSSLELKTNVSGFQRTEPNLPGNILQNTDNLPDSSSISINWVAALGFFTKYQISYRSPDSDQPIIAGYVDRDVTDYTIFMLEGSMYYSIIVQTVSGSKLSVPRILQGARTSRRFLHLQDVSENSITVNWYNDNDDNDDDDNYSRFWLQLQVKDEGGFSSIPNYQYPMGESNGAYRLPTDELIQEFPNLVSGQIYRITISDIPPQTDPMQLDVFYARTVPAQPTNVRVLTQKIVNKNAFVRIGWTPPSDLIDGLVVTYEPNNGRQESPIQLGQGATNIIIDGLDVDTTYTNGQVRSVVGEVGRFRQESEELIQSKSFLVQKLPNDFIIKSVTNTAITMVWNIIDNGDVEGSSVKIESSTGQTLDRRDTPLSDASKGGYTFRQLSAGYTYTIVLSVIPISVVNNRELTSILVTTVPYTVTGLTVPYITSSSLWLQWDQFDGTYTDFEVTYSTASDDNGVSMTTKNTKLELKYLSSNAEYTVAVVTVSGERRSEPVVITEYTAPIPTGQLSIVSFTTTTIDITWGRSYDPLATGYTIQAMTDTESGQAQHETAVQLKSIGDLQAMLVDLFPGRLYKITLRVIGVMDQEETYLQQFTKPEQPKNLQLGIEQSNNQANLIISWDPVSNIDRYLVEYRNSPTSDYQTLFGNTESRISGIDRFATYYVRVFAILEHTDNDVRSEPTENSITYN